MAEEARSARSNINTQRAAAVLAYWFKLRATRLGQLIEKLEEAEQVRRRGCSCCYSKLQW